MILGIIGLVFFLLGLLFFLVKTTETATVIGRDVEGGARFTATGSSSSEVSEVLRLRLTPSPTVPALRPLDGSGGERLPELRQGVRPWIDHAGVRWTLGKAGKWQWFDEDVRAWRWYEDGTMSSPLAEIPMRLREAAAKPSKRIDPAVVAPPSQRALESPAPAKRTERAPEIPSGDAPALAAEIERLADLHERGVLTDDEFQEAKQRVLRDRDSEAQRSDQARGAALVVRTQRPLGLMAEVTRGR